MPKRSTASIDDVLASATPRTASAKICLRGDLLGRHQQLEEALAVALRDDQIENRHAQAPGVAEQIEQLQAEIDAASVEFVFTSIGRGPWSELMSKHPATEDHRKVGYEFDPLTFPVAAVAASCTSHPMSEDDARKLSAKLSEGQWQRLWGGCLTANVDGRDPFSVAAFAILHGSATRSEQPITTESLAASS